MEEGYFKRFFTLEVVVYWMQLIVEFVAALHQQGFNLGIPIERCLLMSVVKMNDAIDNLREKGLPVDDEAIKHCISKYPPIPVFFYFQQMSALRYQCSILG